MVNFFKSKGGLKTMGSRCAWCKYYQSSLLLGYETCTCKDKDLRNDYFNEDIDCPYFEDDVWN